MQRRQAIALLAAALVPRRARAAAAPVALHAFSTPLMGTKFSIRCYHAEAAHAQQAAAAAFATAAQINAVASDYLADSEILSLSKAAPGTATAVSPLLFELLSEARAAAKLTDGAFDPTLGPLTRLWRESRRRGRLPDPAVLASARAACGWPNLLLDQASNSVTLARPGMRLDLGGIAKGQAADAMVRVLAQHGIERCCITAGGDVRSASAPPGRAGWSVAMHPNAQAENEPPLVLANAAVSTSGDLYQSIEIHSTRYSHIIDPATGLGLTRRVSACVVAPTATLSDALATACCVADPATVRVLARRWGALELRLNQA
jgi:thiamine biosynthesis lipoprotein